MQSNHFTKPGFMQDTLISFPVRFTQCLQIAWDIVKLSLE